MATVVREIERKYDPAEAGPAALDAVEAMIGEAGVAAVAPRKAQISTPSTTTPGICGCCGPVSRCGAAPAARMQAGT